MSPQLFTIEAIGEGTIGLLEKALSGYRSYRSTIGVLSESTIGTIGPGLNNIRRQSIARVLQQGEGAKNKHTNAL